MLYRIRYRADAANRPDEFVVDAASPAQAMMKFRCIHGRNCHAQGPAEQATSVCRDDTGAWDSIVEPPESRQPDGY